MNGQGKGNPRFGNNLPTKRTQKNNTVPLNKWEKVMQERLNDVIKNAVEKAKEDIAGAFESVYEILKPGYEQVTLINEDDAKLNITKKIETDLIFEEDLKKPNVLVARVVTGSEIEAKSLKAQSVGTGMGVDKEILDFFGAEEKKKKTKNNKATDFSAWFFNPNNYHLKLVIGIMNIFRSKIRRK